jgi:hypothetical protein
MTGMETVWNVYGKGMAQGRVLGLKSRDGFSSGRAVVGDEFVISTCCGLGVKPKKDFILPQSANMVTPMTLAPPSSAE